jgi:LemA protein
MKGLFIALGVLLVIILMGGCSYNGMNAARIDVNKKWATVQSAYQRRADLIPNLVATVKGAADFEKSTYVQVAMARSRTLNSLTQGGAETLTPDKMAQIQKTSNEAQTAARMAINIAVEQYPQLKANQNFQQLQDELAGTENRINVSRNYFNESVGNYNIKVTSFPGNIMAKMFGFREQAMFQSDPGAQNAPKVQF